MHASPGPILLLLQGDCPHLVPTNGKQREARVSGQTHSSPYLTPQRLIRTALDLRTERVRQRHHCVHYSFPDTPSSPFFRLWGAS